MAKQAKIDSKSKLKRIAIDQLMSSPMDTMSDDQLKIKLSHHGYPNMPITTTTRDTLIRMLKNTPRLTINPTSGNITNMPDTSSIIHNSINGKSTITSASPNTLSNNNKIAIKKRRSTSVSRESPGPTHEEMNTKSDRQKIPAVTTDRDMSKNNEVALMTDEQLRTALLKYGFGNMPITDTTRCTLKNKLKIYIYNINFTFALIDNNYCDSTVTDIRVPNKAKCGHHAKTEEVRLQRITQTVCRLCSKQCDIMDNSKLKKSKRKSLKMATLDTNFTCQGTSKACKLCSKLCDTIDNSNPKTSEHKSLKMATLDTNFTLQGTSKVCKLCSKRCDTIDDSKPKTSEHKSLKMATLDTNFTCQGTSKVCKLSSKQCDTIDDSNLKKTERKNLKMATLETEYNFQGNKEVHFNCSSKTKKGKNQPITVSMQHGTLHHSFTRVQRRMRNFHMTSVHDNVNNGSSDNDEPFEEIINRFLGNSYPLSCFSNYW